MIAEFLSRLAKASLIAASVLVLDAHAADDAPDNYAVISAIGDQLTVVTYEPAIGSHLDANQKQVLPLADHQFDRQACNATAAAIRRTLPGAKLQSIASPDGGSFDADEEKLSSDSSRAALIDSLRGELRNDPRYLVVIAKHRADARLRMAHASTGSGSLSGLGFYLDRIKRVNDSRTGNRGTGFVAPYAYVSATLIDLRSGAIVRTESTEQTLSIATAHSPTAIDPWDAMTPEQKVRAIGNLVRRAIDDMVPKLVAPA